MISPVEFIPVAEDTGLIVAIGRWVLREACRQNMEWQRAGLRPLRVAVNLSARQFRSDELLNEIDAALAESGLAVDSLELEVTESMVMEDLNPSFNCWAQYMSAASTSHWMISAPATPRLLTSSAFR